MPPQAEPARRDVIAVGTSAGGMGALETILRGLPADLPAAVLITEHLFNFDSILVEALERKTVLPIAFARHGQPVELGRVYVAPPDRHLLVTNGSLELGHGPREGLQRPSINVMFRSVAATYGDRAIGVVLTGLLDDGAAGLWEIQQRGGLTVVQDPRQAAYPAMPTAALKGVDVDYVVGLAEMPALLVRLATGKERGRGVRMASVSSYEEPTQQTCPECGGGLIKTRIGGIDEYRCHVGHRLGGQTMIEAKTALQERILLAALAQTEELVQLLETMGSQVQPAMERNLEEQIGNQRQLVHTLRQQLGLKDVA